MTGTGLIAYNPCLVHLGILLGECKVKYLENEVAGAGASLEASV